MHPTSVKFLTVLFFLTFSFFYSTKAVSPWDRATKLKGFSDHGSLPEHGPRYQNRQRGLSRPKLSLDPNRIKLHPLDPLTESEISRVVTIVNSYRNEDWKFNLITLREPEKSTLLPFFLRGRIPHPLSIPRRAFVILLNKSNGGTHEVVVNLDSQRVETWNKIPLGIQAPITPWEILEAERVLMENTTVQERCRQLGWEDMNLVTTDPWQVGFVKDRPELDGKRLTQHFMLGRNYEKDNFHAHPFDFVVIVDLIELKVVAIEDLPTHDDFDTTNKEGNVVPREESNYLPELRDPSFFRQDLKPINISQIGGPSFQLNGNALKWQKFNMHVGFNWREGLVIHHVSYNDGDIVRPLFYRMSFVEMLVSYGDPRPPFHRKQGYDLGHFGFGIYANELQAQVDCIGEVRMIDSVIHTESGEPIRRKQVVCIHEEDVGLLWTHTDFKGSGQRARVRSQRLVLTFLATVGNYDYQCSFYFYQDGTIEANAKLTGIMSSHLLAQNSTPAGFGTEVFPQINAQYHQHFFTVRLDAEIDGNENTVVVQDVVPLQASTGSQRNPYRQGFTTKTTVLKTAGQARTNIAPESSRVWLIRNSNSVNPYTKSPVAWKLVPWPNPRLLMKRDSPLFDQAAWLDFDTWVTPYQENQIFPGGYYLNNSGLTEWVGGNMNANVLNQDIVLWHTFGTTHIPRAEDFPVMPVESCSVSLKPVNFFRENPALDIPPPRDATSHDEL